MTNDTPEYEQQRNEEYEVFRSALLKIGSMTRDRRRTPERMVKTIGFLVDSAFHRVGEDALFVEAPREVYFARWVASRPCECAPGKPPCFPCGARNVIPTKPSEQEPGTFVIIEEP